MAAVTISRYLFPDDPHHGDGCSAEIELRLPQRGRVLDLGCGNNAILSGLRTSEREVWGTDMVVHPKLEHAAWFRQTSQDGRIPFEDDTFDLVVSLFVIEHVDDPQAFLREVSRVLRPGGHFIGHSISGSHYVSWVRRAVGVLPHSTVRLLVKKLYGRDEEDTFKTYYRLNRTGSIDRNAAAVGMKRVQMKRYSDQGGYFRPIPPLVPAAIVLDWTLDKIRPGWGRIYFTTTLQKPTSA